MSRMPLAVIRGLTYFDVRQVFNRWLIPTYQTAFRWTGNRSDSEDASQAAPYRHHGLLTFTATGRRAVWPIGG